MGLPNILIGPSRAVVVDFRGEETRLWERTNAQWARRKAKKAKDGDLVAVKKVLRRVLRMELFE